MTHSNRVFAVMLDKLDQLKIKTSGLQITAPAQKFTALGHNLQLYADALINMTSQTNERISEILPSIKGGGGHSEEDLVQLLTDYTQSQFELDTSTTFLIGGLGTTDYYLNLLVIIFRQK